MSLNRERVFVPVAVCIKDGLYYLKGFAFCSCKRYTESSKYLSQLDFTFDVNGTMSSFEVFRKDNIFMGEALVSPSSIEGFRDKMVCCPPFSNNLVFPRLQLKGISALGKDVYQIFAPKGGRTYTLGWGVWLLSTKSARFMRKAEFDAIKDTLTFGNYDPKTGLDKSDSIFIYPFNDINLQVHNQKDIEMAGKYSEQNNLITSSVMSNIDEDVFVPDNIHLLRTGGNCIKSLYCSQNMIGCQACVSDAVYAPDTCNYFSISSAGEAIDLSIPRVVTNSAPCAWGGFSLRVPKNDVTLDMSQYTGLKTCDIVAKTISEDSIICLGKITRISLAKLPRRMNITARGISDDIILNVVPTIKDSFDTHLCLKNIKASKLTISFPVTLYLPKGNFNIHLAKSVHLDTLEIVNSPGTSYTLDVAGSLTSLEINTRERCLIQSRESIQRLVVTDNKDDTYTIRDVTKCRITLPDKRMALRGELPVLEIAPTRRYLYESPDYKVIPWKE